MNCLDRERERSDEAIGKALSLKIDLEKAHEARSAKTPVRLGATTEQVRMSAVLV